MEFTDSESVEALLAAIDSDHRSSSISFCDATISLKHNHLEILASYSFFCLFVKMYEGIKV